MTRRKLLGIIPIPFVLGGVVAASEPTDYEVVVINEDVMRGLGHADAEWLFTKWKAFVWGPKNAIEIRHKGKVVKRHRGSLGRNNQVEK